MSDTALPFKKKDGTAGLAMVLRQFHFLSYGFYFAGFTCLLCLLWLFLVRKAGHLFGAAELTFQEPGCRIKGQGLTAVWTYYLHVISLLS